MVSICKILFFQQNFYAETNFLSTFKEPLWGEWYTYRVSYKYRVSTRKKIRKTIESKIRVLMKRNSSSKLSSLYFKKIAKKRKRMFRYVLGKKRHPVRSRNKWKRRRGTCEHGARFDFRWNGNARRVVIRPSNRSSRSILLAPIMDACFSSN